MATQGPNAFTCMIWTTLQQLCNHTAPCTLRSPVLTCGLIAALCGWVEWQLIGPPLLTLPPSGPDSPSLWLWSQTLSLTHLTGLLWWKRGAGWRNNELWMVSPLFYHYIFQQLVCFGASCPIAHWTCRGSEDALFQGIGSHRPDAKEFPVLCFPHQSMRLKETNQGCRFSFACCGNEGSVSWDISQCPDWSWQVIYKHLPSGATLNAFIHSLLDDSHLLIHGIRGESNLRYIIFIYLTFWIADQFPICERIRFVWFNGKYALVFINIKSIFSRCWENALSSSKGLQNAFWKRNAKLSPAAVLSLPVGGAVLSFIGKMWLCCHLTHNIHLKCNPASYQSFWLN